MYEVDRVLVVSPSDLTRFMECRHASWLGQQVAAGALARPEQSVDESLERLFQRGIEHEQAFLQTLRDEGREIVEIPFDRDRGLPGLRAAERATEEAMAAGADVIYQATFFDGRWRGHADFLLKTERPGRWDWSYDVADTKLARRMKVAALLQMATYADRLTTLQGVASEQLIVVTGDGVARPYRFADAAAYAANVRRDLLAFVGEPGREPTRPEPVEHCAQCRWSPRCQAQWRREDDLSLVAWMRRDQARALREAGIETVRALGETTPGDLPLSIGEDARVRLADQARLQLLERDTGEPRYELLAPQEGRGLALLPDPSPGDVFFDIEGDPFLGDHGLEYLFGVVDAGGFTAYWAIDPADEKRAFEQLMDHLMAALDRDPGMHVYHYASYEPSRLKQLSGRYATRAEELDRLLRGQRLVDLYTVVRQGLRVSKKSCSIKQLEHFYWGDVRGHEGVSDALGSVVAFERWLESGDQALLDDIEAYNKVDCESTLALRDWLEERRVAGGGDTAYPRPVHSDGRASDLAVEAADEVARVTAALLDGIPDAGRTAAEEARALLAGLLDWHRREALPEWWEYFTRLKMDDDELVEDSASLGRLGAPVAVGTVRQSTIWRLAFPPQETKIGPGDDKLIDPVTEKTVGTVVGIDPEQGVVEILRGTRNGQPTAKSLVPGKPIVARDQQTRLLDLTRWVLAYDIDSPSSQWRVGRDLLLRHRPRVAAETYGLRLPGEPAEEALCRLADQLTDSVLPVQGPPGTGKTWAGARMILRLVADGKRVGITAFSHKAISNLLDAVADAADEAGVSVRMLQKANEQQRCQSTDVVVTDAPKDVEAAVDAGEADVVAGTTWLFARAGLLDRFDVLVIDEAGQLSLANVLAVSGAASSLVMLGDPQQLAQPVKGQHPPGAEASAMEHLLDGAATVPPDRGLLLDTTWRMHDDVAGFVSRMSYDGRLLVEHGCSQQRVESASALGGTGLRLSLVPHVDNAAASTEEAVEVARLCREVLADGIWHDRTGGVRPLEASDVMVLTPFNAQIHRIRTCLGTLADEGGVRVGTVDKFQGQEAVVVIYSLASSSAQDAPRGVEFLFNVNRFNVAISRARAVVCVICSPLLLSAPVRKPEQLRMVNALCQFAAEAERIERP